MPASLLTTKLYSPSPLHKLVARPRLIERLENGWSQGRGLTIISASAGFGKTTLITDWLQQSKHSTAWLSLDNGDNDPSRFWRYVITALQTIDASWGATALAMLSAPQTPPLESVVTMLINDLVAATNSIMLVLDDYHVIAEPQIHTSLDFFLDRLPPQLHVVIATREDPPLSLPRRRARSKLTEVRASDLRFTLSESTEFLNALMQLELTRADIEALEQRTEGWVVGLQLAALSLQGRADQHAFITAFAGDDRYIADYLIEEVIQRQSPAVQEFLLKTASLSRFCADLCDAVLDRHNSRTVLSDLERENLFIVPLDNRREWYRYHRLFADLLRQRLIGSIGETAIIDLHHRASVWFKQHNLLDEAIDQSLTAHDFDRAAQLIEKHNEWLFQHSELQTLADYTAALPPAILNQRLPLLAMRSWALLATGHYAEAAQCVKSIQQAAQIDDASWSRWNQLTPPAQAALIESSAMAMRFAIDQGDIDQTLALAQHLLPRLNDDQQVWLYNPSYALRPPIRFMQGMAYEIRGDLLAAETEFRAATQEGVENQHVVALAIGHLGAKTCQRAGTLFIAIRRCSASRLRQSPI
jgi:LuxR family maltose regulon positive regulatory protein